MSEVIGFPIYSDEKGDMRMKMELIYCLDFNLLLLDCISEQIAVYRAVGCLGTRFEGYELGRLLIMGSKLRWLWKHPVKDNPATLARVRDGIKEMKKVYK